MDANHPVSAFARTWNVVFCKKVSNMFACPFNNASIVSRYYEVECFKGHTDVGVGFSLILYDVFLLYVSIS